VLVVVDDVEARTGVDLSSCIQQMSVETGVVVIERVVHAVSVRQLDPQPVSALQWNDAGVGSRSSAPAAGQAGRRHISAT